jgi:hypothetical protein
MDAMPGFALMQRLDALAASLARRDDALALLALGSVGRETDRLDRWSDLDFFVLVREGGAKARYVAELDWLAEAHPIAWSLRNTADGHKVLMADGVYCEFAVFEPRELAHVAYAPGRFVWRRAEVDAALADPAQPLPGARDASWLVGETLSNLLIGLQRFARGERLAAMRLVQVCALDRLLELRELHGRVIAEVRRDPYNVDRRVEQRQPGVAARLPHWAAGYEQTPRAALAILDELRQFADVPAAMAERIGDLARPATP